MWQSDRNLKKNIRQTKVDATEIVKAIGHYEFEWKRDDDFVKLGYVAQQLEDLDEDFVLKIKQPEGSEYEYLCQINEFTLVPYLSKCLQEVIGRLEKVEEKIL